MGHAPRVALPSGAFVERTLHLVNVAEALLVRRVEGLEQHVAQMCVDAFGGVDEIGCDRILEVDRGRLATLSDGGE